MTRPAAPPFDYEGIFRSTASAYLILDTRLVIVEVNTAYLEATSRTRESVLGKHIFDAFPENPNDPQATGVRRLFESLQRVMQSKTRDSLGLLQYDIPVGPPEEGRFEKRFWSPVNSPVLDQEGRLTHIIHQAIDVTARVASEIALRASEHRFNALRDVTGDVIYRMSPDWRFMDELNGRGFLRGTDARGEWRVEDYVPAENIAAVREAIDEAIRTKSAFELEHPVLRADGNRGWTVSRAVPVLDTRGEIVEWLGSASDISARKLAEEQLRDADRRKDEFLAMLAHELRNPLAPIASAASLLRLAAHDEARVRKTSEIVARQVQHLTGLVDDLLDVSRVTRGHVELDCVPLDLRSIIQDALEQVRPFVEQRRHRLIFHTTPFAATVSGDPKRLTQVVTNLLTNAAKYTPAGGEISVDLEQDPTHVSVVIRDNGVGMSPKLIESCFELFVQAERTSDRAAGGLGIGLALVKRLVELHAGRIAARSDGDGRGSTFTVTLPRIDDAALSSSGTSDSLAPASSRLRVFVVDDNADAAHMLAMLIDGLGYEASVETQPRLALERIRLESPDVCLLDVGMPEIDGLALARTIRSTMAEAPMLVAITGYSQPQDRAAALEAGFNEHFAKPVESVKLANLLSNLAPIDTARRRRAE
ncbi:MAG: PAS domain-containing hybrid sensor histidine kinase/response regulator [Ramlibacter sp.]